MTFNATRRLELVAATARDAVNEAGRSAARVVWTR
jgi:hypothetical protein